MDITTIFRLSFLPTNLTKTQRNREIHTLTCVHCGINTLTRCKCKYFSLKYCHFVWITVKFIRALCNACHRIMGNNFLLPIFEPSSSSSVFEFFNEDYVPVDLRHYNRTNHCRGGTNGLDLDRMKYHPLFFGLSFICKM